MNLCFGCNYLCDTETGNQGALFVRIFEPRQLHIVLEVCHQAGCLIKDHNYVTEDGLKRNVFQSEGMKDLLSNCILHFEVV